MTKALMVKERSIIMTNTSPNGRGSLLKKGLNGGEVQTEDIDSDDMDLDDGDDSERDHQSRGSDKGEEVQKDVDEENGSGAANETAVSAKSAGPGVDSKYPMFLPVGARMILNNLGPNKGGPNGPPINMDDLIGKLRRRCLDRSRN